MPEISFVEVKNRAGQLRLEICTADANCAERRAIEAADRLRR